MLQSSGGHLLSDQLLQVARDPELRTAIYEQLGEYCHQCRNRLNSLKLSLYLLIKLSPDSDGNRWLPIDRDYRELERRVDQIQAVCRPLNLTRVTLGLDLLIDDRREHWSELMARSGATLEFASPVDRVIASFDVERLGQGLDSFVTWRAGELRDGASVQVRWWSDARMVHWVWEESSTQSESISELAPHDEATWTLPMLVRIVLAHHGDFQVQTDRGYRLEISWPIFVSPF